MQRGYKSDDRTDASNNDRDVDSGDLSAWEYLTTNFDDVGFLQEHNYTHPQVGANTHSATTFDVTLQQMLSFPQAVPLSNERIDFSCQDMNHHLRDEIVQDGRATNFSIGNLSHCILSILSHFVICIIIIIISQLSCMLSRFLVPLPGPNIFESAKLLHTNLGSLSNTDNRNRDDFQQPRLDHNVLIQDIRQYPMSLPGFNLTKHSLNRSCNMVELSSNQLGLLNQSAKSNEKLVVSSSQSDSHQSMGYAPPLPPHELLKPLTAYHYFYRVERDNIVQGMTSNDSYISDPVHDFSEKKLRELLERRWYMDPIRKRRAHRKTLGKLGFEK
jgi:hypothetical protein